MCVRSVQVFTYIGTYTHTVHGTLAWNPLVNHLTLTLTQGEGQQPDRREESSWAPSDSRAVYEGTKIASTLATRGPQSWLKTVPHRPPGNVNEPVPWPRAPPSKYVNQLHFDHMVSRERNRYPSPCERVGSRLRPVCIMKLCRTTQEERPPPPVPLGQYTRNSVKGRAQDELRLL